MKLLRLAAISLCVLAAGCGSGGRSSSPRVTSGGARPSWIDGESARFPRSQYVTGVGSADDEASAAERARGEVARVFTAAVTADTSVDESETNIAQGGRSSSSNAQTVAQRVRSVSEKVLEGLEIVERWKDSSGRHYALAALSKAKALAAVEERTQALDAEAALWKGRLDSVTDKFERAKAAARLSNLLKTRLELENDRRVLGGGSLPSTIDVASAKDAAVRALAALDVMVAVTGEGSEEVETGIVAGLVANGLTAKRGNPGDAGDMIVEAGSTIEPIESPDPKWKWSRATAIITLKDGRESKSFAKITASEREAAGDARQARRRSLESLAKKAAEKTSAAIAAFFNGQ